MANTGRRLDLPSERLEKLRDILRQDGVSRLDDLCRRVGASAATIRRDLDILENHGSIRRVHGGAVSVESRLEEPLFDDKASISAREQLKIAEAAAGMITSGNSVFLDGGSTVLLLARLLCERTDITIVTNSLRAAVELAGRGPRLIVTGGQLRRVSETMVGPLSTRIPDQLRVDRAFMGTIGISIKAGLTTTDPDEAYTKEQVISRAGEVIVLADSTKLGKVSFSRFGHVSDMDLLITDRKANAAFTREMRRRSVKVVIA
ncbi:MAG: DeoR/GlpR family DNA-binding transcription regulator [bacterium]